MKQTIIVAKALLSPQGERQRERNEALADTYHMQSTDSSQSGSPFFHAHTNKQNQCVCACVPNLTRAAKWNQVVNGEYDTATSQSKAMTLSRVVNVTGGVSIGECSYWQLKKYGDELII